MTVVNQLGLHARAAARFVHLATRFESQIRVGRDSKVMDGKSIMGILLLAAARGTTITVSADGPDEDARRRGAGRSSSNRDLVRNRGTPERYRRVARRRRRPRARRDSAHAGASGFRSRPDRVARELSALERARQRSREQLEQIRRRIAELHGRRPRGHLRRAAADARRSDARRTGGRRRSRRAGQRRMGGAARARRSSPRSSTTSTIRTCTSARATCTTSPAACA